VQACPTAALAQNPAGWVTLDQALCIACGACLDSCPFGAIATDSEGHATKCDGCAAQVSAGAEPTCVRACPMRALRLDSADACPNRISDATWDDAGMAPRVRYLVRSAPELEVPDA
ncbi:MAG: 4Fe-4S binding protein, partial [Chloroflexi bacterium]|nr:4Fe-4S binding protein [Chloroflexota bacterium]